MFFAPLVCHVRSVHDVGQGYHVLDVKEALDQDGQFRVRKTQATPLYFFGGELEMYVVGRHDVEVEAEIADPKAMVGVPEGAGVGNRLGCYGEVVVGSLFRLENGHCLFHEVRRDANVPVLSSVKVVSSKPGSYGQSSEQRQECAYIPDSAGAVVDQGRDAAEGADDAILFQESGQLEHLKSSVAATGRRLQVHVVLGVPVWRLGLDIVSEEVGKRRFVQFFQQVRGWNAARQKGHSVSRVFGDGDERGMMMRWRMAGWRDCLMFRGCGGTRPSAGKDGPS